jgi:hypothetical protein
MLRFENTASQVPRTAAKTIGIPVRETAGATSLAGETAAYSEAENGTEISAACSPYFARGESPNTLTTGVSFSIKCG